MNASGMMLGMWMPVFSLAGYAQDPGAQSQAPTAPTTPPHKDRKETARTGAATAAPPEKIAETSSTDSPLVRAAKKNKNYRIQPGIVITNANVGKTSPAGGKVVQEKGDATPAGEEAPVGETVDTAGHDKAFWQSAMQQARQDVTAAQERVGTLQTDISRLQNDFYAWDDPAYRDGVIKPALDQALTEIAKARKDVEISIKRVTELAEEARKSGALPGWLR